MNKNACCGITSMCQGAINQQLGVMANETNRQTTSPPRIVPFSSSPPGSLGEQQPQSTENAKSAFEITSVSDAPPDGEEEQVQSRDAEDAKGNVREHDKRDGSDYPNGDNPESSQQEQLGDPSGYTLASSSTSDLSESCSRPLNAAAASIANGPSQIGQSRFRRVNHYVRGRWIVRDTLEPEERPESENKMAPLPLPAAAVRNNSDLSSAASPVVSRKTIPDPDIQSRSRSASELGYLPDVSSTTSREQSTITDRSSTTVESHTISRNTSLSSLSVHTTERTTEEDQRQRLEEVEPECPLMVNQRTHQDSATQCTPEEQLPPHHCNCSVCMQSGKSEQDQKHSLENAVLHLQEQLNQFLSSHGNSHLTLTQELGTLTSENTRLKEQIETLIEENKRLRSIANVHPNPDAGLS